MRRSEQGCFKARRLLFRLTRLPLIIVNLGVFGYTAPLLLYKIRSLEPSS